MRKKYKGYLCFIISSIWLITGILNSFTAKAHFSNKTSSLGRTYTGLAGVCIGLAIIYLSLGIKRRKNDKEDSK